MRSGSVLYLSRSDVEAVQLPMVDIIQALEAMFEEKGNGKVEMPPKPGAAIARIGKASSGSSCSTSAEGAGS